MLVISALDRRILYLSHTFVGTVHDFSMLKTVLPPQKNWFGQFEVRLDLGFQGFADLYKCKQLYIPQKKPRKSDLTEQQKQENKEQASQRVVVEHSIGGLKRYRFLSDRLRCHDDKLYNRIAGVCAALWNYHIMLSC